MNYYYLKNGETLGPLPVGDLIKIIDEGTLVWNEDGSMKEWLPAKDVEPVYTLYKAQIKPLETKQGNEGNAYTHAHVNQNLVDKKRVFNDYIANRLSDGFDIIKRDDENLLVIIEKKQNGINPKTFNHTFYLLFVVVAVCCGIAWVSSNYSSPHLVVWLIYVAGPIILGVTIWKINYNKFLNQPSSNNILKLRAAIDGSGQVIEKTI